jgi:hypothetical protein
VFPFEKIPLSSNLEVVTALFGMLKVVRIRRLPVLINRLNMKLETTAVAKAC